MLAEVHDQPGAEGLAGHAGAGPAWDQGNLVLAGVTYEGAYVIFVARHGNAQRPDLEDAGVGAVQGASQLIEEELPLDETAKVVADALALLVVHGAILRPKERAWSEE
jgi:hypothetical protein